MARGFQKRAALCGIVAAVAGLLLLGITSSIAQVLQYKRPTEEVVKRYEKLVDQGAFLSPEGWARASRLFERVSTYPANSEIQIQSFPGLIGELSRNGSRAQVETKWGDYYGTIDAYLRFKPAEPDAAIMMGESVSLVFVNNTTSKGASAPGEWKIEETPHVRLASPAVAIKYLEIMRDQSKDPVIRKNAAKTLEALKRMTPGCGNASAC